MNIVAHEDTTRYAAYHMRWHAIATSAEDDPDRPIGFGPTREAAVAALLAQIAHAAEPLPAQADKL
jgi:hypothetical protein